MTGQSDFYGQQAQNTAQSYAKMGSSLGEAGMGALTAKDDTALGRYMSSDENMKEKISYDDPEVQAFMDRVSKKFIKE